MIKTREYIVSKKAQGQPICALTCYDYPTACWQEKAGIDLVLVGDSLGVNVLGYNSTREVTMQDMLHHLRSVRRGLKTPYLLVDMPFGSYETRDSALDNALQFKEAGADGVKIEGFRPDIVSNLVKNGIDVCGHLGLTPQLHKRMSPQAKTGSDAARLVQDALALEKEGVWTLVLELIPEPVAREVSERIFIPTIGIGAGRFTDGQILVAPDILGISSFDLRHNRKYAHFHETALEALGTYIEEVRQGKFPESEHCVPIADSDLEEFKASLEALDA